MEPWDSWCVLQMSYPHSSRASNGAYSRASCSPLIDCTYCIAAPPPSKTTLCSPSGLGLIVTCAQYIYCTGVNAYCVCDADRCEAPPDRSTSFDITFNSDTPSTAAIGVVRLKSLVALQLFR